MVCSLESVVLQALAASDSKIVLVAEVYMEVVLVLMPLLALVVSVLVLFSVPEVSDPPLEHHQAAWHLPVWPFSIDVIQLVLSLVSRNTHVLSANPHPCCQDSSHVDCHPDLQGIHHDSSSFHVLRLACRLIQGSHCRL